MSSKKTTLKIFKPLNTIWHEDTKLVFKSRTEHMVIGKWVDEELRKLTPSDVEECLTLKFKYDDSQVEEESGEEEVEGTGGEEEVEGTGGEEEGTGGEEEGDGEEEVEAIEQEQESVEEDTLSAPSTLEETKEDTNDTTAGGIEERKEETKSGEDECVTSANLVTGITKQKESIFKEMESLVGLVTKEVVQLEQKLIQKNKDYEDLLSRHNALTENFNNLEKDYKKLQAKFDGIKQLFN